MKRFKLLMLLFLVGGAGCDTQWELPYAQRFSFDSGLEGWTVGFADYPQGEEAFYELDSAHEALPNPLNSNDKAVWVAGNNHSDDLFMFLKKQWTGLTPNTQYEVQIAAELASNAPQESFGIGGSPGASVYVKMGAATQEPKTVKDGEGWLRMNLDKGNQATDGAQARSVGTVGIGGSEAVYKLISRNNHSKPQVVTTDANGAFWLMVGTDSGFEGTTEVYWNTIEVRIKAK